jgi:hypothetical protein
MIWRFAEHLRARASNSLTRTVEVRACDCESASRRKASHKTKKIVGFCGTKEHTVPIELSKLKFKKYAVDPLSKGHLRSRRFWGCNYHFPFQGRSAQMRNPNRLTRGTAPNRAREAWQRPGTFRPGHRKMAGRTQGTRNVMTRELKSAVIRAAHRLGRDLKGQDGIVGYLMRLAEHDPKTFVMLLRAVLPLQVKSLNAEQWKQDISPDGKPIFRDIEQELHEAGLPTLLMRLEPVVQEIRNGTSPAVALVHAGLNSRVERIKFSHEELMLKYRVDIPADEKERLARLAISRSGDE